MSDGVIFLLDGDGTPLDFGQPYASIWLDGWWATAFDENWVVSLLPRDSTTPWELAIEAVDADMVARDPVNLLMLARSDANTPPEWLPYLAAERSVDEFSGAWTEARQRSVVAGSFGLHQKLGVRRALEEALAPLEYSTTVVEWFEAWEKRTPYTFRIQVLIPDDQEWLASDRPQIIRVANGAKNAHTKLEALDLIRKVGPAVLFVGGVVVRRQHLVVGQVPKPTEFAITGHIYVGAIPVLTRRLTINQGP